MIDMVFFPVDMITIVIVNHSEFSFFFSNSEVFRALTFLKGYDFPVHLVLVCCSMESTINSIGNTKWI